MAKLYLDRLRKKYGAKGWSGDRYRQLMELIIGSNHENVANAYGRRTQNYYNDKFARIKKTTAVQLKAPPMDEVMPRREVYLRKGADRGKMLTDALRDKLSKNLRDSVKQYMIGGKESMQYQRGEQRGRMKPELVKQFQKSIMQTFEGYTKSHGGEVPANIKTIATTEVRSAISDMKHEYATNLVKENAGKLDVVKRWVHHDNLSAEARPGHARMDGKKVPLNQAFSVPMLRRKGKLIVNTGTCRMLHPHATDAPAEEVINCHCECDYVTQVIPQRPIAKRV